MSPWCSWRCCWGGLGGLSRFRLLPLALALGGLLLATDWGQAGLSNYQLGNRVLSILLIAVTGLLGAKLQVQMQEILRTNATVRETRKRLENTSEMLEMATRLTGVGGWSAQLDAVNVEWTREVCRIHEVAENYTPNVDEAIDFYAPEHRERIRKLFNRCSEDGEAFDTELQIITASGKRVWVRAVGQPMRNQAGHITGARGALVDIDQQKRAHDLIEKSQREASILSQRLEQTLEGMLDGFFTLDHDWRFSYINAVGERLLKRRREDLIGRNVWEEFPEAAATVFEEHFRHTMETGEAVAFATWYEPLSTWFEVRAYRVADGLAVHYQDTTQRRQADQQLRLLQSAIEHINDIVLITEAEPLEEPGPRIVYVNRAFERLTGFHRDQAIGRNPRILQGPGTDRSELDRIRRALETGQSVQTKLKNYRKDGQGYWLEISIAPLIDASGTTTHFVAIERDITLRLEMEEQLRQAQRLESVGHLTGGIAHDFNNLLTVIIGNAELLTESTADDPELQQLTRVISTAAQRGAKLTQRLLAFARRQALDPQPVEVNLLIAGIDDLLRRTLGDDIEIELTRGAGLWQALIDPGQLEDALLNLCINARDAMPDGGRLTIETANARIDRDYADTHGIKPGQYVMVAVSDTGEGIPEDNLDRVFEPFFTTKRENRGTGLGLSMVYGFVKQSGGHVKIYSEMDQGTTIKIYLPRSLELIAQEARTPSAVVDDSSGETILLVEDDDLVRRHVNGLLKSLGYRVLTASDGHSALGLLDSHQEVALLFTDVVMPGGMGGRELADHALERRPDLRVLFTSGYTENSIVHHGRLDPGVMLLSKPYRKAELARAVRDALRDQGDNHD